MFDWVICPKLCANFSAKFPHQAIRWNYGIFRSKWNNYHKFCKYIRIKILKYLPILVQCFISLYSENDVFVEWNIELTWVKLQSSHCVKIVRIWSFLVRIFPHSKWIFRISPYSVQMPENTDQKPTQCLCYINYYNKDDTIMKWRLIPLIKN